MQLVEKDDSEDKMEIDFKKFKEFKDFGIMGVNVYKEPDYKAKLKIGNLQFLSEKRFNWFKRFMLKSVFGIEVINFK